MNPTQLIDKQISDLPNWKGEMLAQLRKIIHTADPDITEEWKWGTAVFTHNGLVCAISAFKNHVKINFFKGATLEDPDKLFNAGLDSKKMRSIDFHEGDSIPESQLKNLVKEAVSVNV
ncbi:MAG TPA: DUF1801 domain-containing protein [Candidatus Nitrosocosmicus sp.]|nr:DUF1801 domain-containing protein [Candidatus Nitrosocosmicus sp.]